VVKEKNEKRRTRAYTRAREKGLFFRVHPTFGVMGAEMKKTAEQIVYLPVSDLSIVANRLNKELSGDIFLRISNNLQRGCSGLEFILRLHHLIDECRHLFFSALSTEGGEVIS